MEKKLLRDFEILKFCVCEKKINFDFEFCYFCLLVLFSLINSMNCWWWCFTTIINDVSSVTTWNVDWIRSDDACFST